jgi:hypothetical protein
MIRDSGGDALPLQCDLSSSDEIQSCCRHCRRGVRRGRRRVLQRRVL